MPKKRKIVDAKSNSDGVTTHVKLDGNSRFTGVKRALPMVERGEVANAHVSKTGKGKKYIRTNPDRSSSNNIDSMSGDE